MTLLVSVLLAGMPPTSVAAATPSPVLEAARQELDRSMNELSGQAVPPYFMSYEISESDMASISSSFGLLQASEKNRQRLLDIDLRVGSYEMDNTRALRGNASGMGGWQRRYSMIPMPLEDDQDAIQSVLWFHTDQNYKTAIEALTKVETDVKVMVEAEDQSADFSREEAQKSINEMVPLNIDLAAWEEKLKRYTAPFAEYGEIYIANASLFASSDTRCTSIARALKFRPRRACTACLSLRHPALTTV